MRYSPIAGLGYIVLETTDVGAWADYGVRVLGMMPSKLPGTPGSAALRMDDRMARIIVTPPDDSDGRAADNSVRAIGWEVADRNEWDNLISRLDKFGVRSTEVTAKEAEIRGVTRLLRALDPSGATIEFGFEPMRDPIDRFVSSLGVKFVTGEQGMGHVTRAVSNYAETVDFYTRVLGFRVRETIDLAIRATFASPNSRQHSIAIIDGHGENQFHHLMVEVDMIDDVGRCLDRVMEGAARLTVGLGRHFNDLMTSFYMMSPSGLQIEYGHGGLRVDPDEWVENAQGGVGGASLWGHHPVPLEDQPESVAAGFRRVNP